MLVLLPRSRKNRGKSQLFLFGGLPKTVTQKKHLTGIRYIPVQKGEVSPKSLEFLAYQRGLVQTCV